MARTNRLGVVDWTIEDEAGKDTITLSASLENQKKLEDGTGKGFFEFVQGMDDPSRNPLMALATLFHYLQVGTDDSADEIFSCFFADLSAYGDSFGTQQTKLINHMLGNKEAAIIAEAQKAEENKGK